MSIVTRSLILAAMATTLAHQGYAQRGGGRGAKVVPPANAKKPDSTKKAPSAVALDFQDQDLKVVLDALVAAGDLNVTMTNIPSQRVTVHMGKPVDRDGMVELVKSVAEANGLKVTQSPTLMQISGTAPEPPQRGNVSLAQQLLQQNQQPPVRLFTYRLKHASAVQLAPVITNLFAGAGLRATGATTIFPNGNGGFTTINTGPPAGANPGVTNIAPPFVGGAGRGGGRGAAAQAAGQAAGQAVLDRLATAFQQSTGALSSQSGDIRVVADEGSNSLLIRATDSDYALIQQILTGIDLRPLQVLIEVTIAEVQRTHDLDVGVSGSVKRIPKGKTAADATATAPSTASARDFILELTGGHGTINYDVALSALQERGDLRVLSLPVIIAQNNRQAVLNVGSSRPFVQVSQTVVNDPTGRVQTVQYIDVATTLTITPTINPDGYVNLVVSQTDNSASNEVQFDAPVINKREATTQVFIRDGQTTVIGGLADHSHNRDVAGIPYLSRIPIIGQLLFGSTTINETASELYLFLTPHVISSDDDIDKLREAVKDGSELLKQIDVSPHIVPKADTISRPPGARPDTGRKPPGDSLTTLRRRPPESPSDSVPPVPKPPVEVSPLASSPLLELRVWR